MRRFMEDVDIRRQMFLSLFERGEALKNLTNQLKHSRYTVVFLLSLRKAVFLH